MPLPFENFEEEMEEEEEEGEVQPFCLLVEKVFIFPPLSFFFFFFLLLLSSSDFFSPNTFSFLSPFPAGSSFWSTDHGMVSNNGFVSCCNCPKSFIYPSNR